MSAEAGTTPLRVAHLDTGRDWRGGQAQVLHLVEGLARRGVVVCLLAPRGPLLDRTNVGGVAAFEWNPRGDWDAWALARAVRILERFVPDVVHCHSARAHAVGVPAAGLARARAVVVSRRVAVPVGRNLFSVLKYRMPVDRYLCVSRGVAEELRRSGIPLAKLALVPDGVSSDPPSAGESLRALAGIPADAPVVGTVAALTAEKRHEDLLAAAAAVARALPRVHFVWFGDGPLRARLERLRSDLGLDARVHLLGFRADARSLMAQCTVIALASDLEGIGTSLMDAQVLGVPVVATAVGGIPEVVENGVTGILVPPRAPAALAAALLEVLVRPERSKEMAERARESAARFHLDRTVDRTLEEYLAVLGSGPSAA